MNTTASTRLEAESWSAWGGPSVPGSVKSGADEPETRRAGPAVPQEAADRIAEREDQTHDGRGEGYHLGDPAAPSPQGVTATGRHFRITVRPVNRQRVDAQIVRPRRRLRPEQGVGDRPFRRLCCCLEER